MYKKGSLSLSLLLLLEFAPRFAWGVQLLRPLLSHATKVTEVKDVATTCWLSDHTLLVVTSDKHKGYLRPDEWKGKAHLLNTHTYGSTALPGLTRMLQHWHCEPQECEPVPGGMGLFWWAAETPDHYPNALISTRDGSRHYHWEFTKFHSSYWLNDHLWVDQDRFSEEYEPHPYLHVYDVNRPHREKRLRVDALATRKWFTQQAVEPFFFDAISDEKDGGYQQPLCIGKYRLADYHLQEHPRPLRAYSVVLPAHSQVQRVEVSPNNKKVLIETASKQWRTLWTCRVDGSHLRSLGSIQLKKDYTLRAKWLPGNKKVCFEVGDNLYTKSAN